MSDAISRDQTFFTDKQLRDRWNCSHMKLWRLRRKGLLESIKIGGVGVNLTPASAVMRLEASK